MPSPFARFTTTDAAKFVDPKSFGERVTYKASGAGAVEISANVSEPFAFQNPGGTGVGTTELTMTVRSEDVPNLAINDQVTRAGNTTRYYVTSFEPDGFGHVLLILSETQVQ
jgi:hypothetical protein